MTTLEYQLELAKFDEAITTSEHDVAQLQMNTTQLKSKRARFVLQVTEGSIKAAKEQEATKKNPSGTSPVTDFTPGSET